MSASPPIIQGVDHVEQWHFKNADGSNRDLAGATFEYFLKEQNGTAVLELADVTVSAGDATGIITRTIPGTASASLATGYRRQQLTAIKGGVRYSLGTQAIEIKDGYTA
jgi:hypothetical protein